MLSLSEQTELPMLRMLTDRGTEYFARAEHNDYELYLAPDDIEHTHTQARTSQASGSFAQACMTCRPTSVRYRPLYAKRTRQG
jgi:hypothetical protein